MNDKIIILGSNSFSGAHFVDHCLSDGLEVLGISRSPEYHPVFLPYKRNPRLHSFSFRQIDINNSSDAWEQILTEFEPDYVVNFAAQGMVSQSWDAPEDWFRTNCVAPLQIYTALRKLKRLKKFVQISTPEVYGNCEGKVKEHYCYQPSTPYAVSKAAADMNLMAFKNAYDFPVVFTRAANVYGPGQQLYRIVPISILNILTGKRLQLHGGGHSSRSFIHISDVAAGTLQAARLADPGKIFHFSTDRMITIRELVVLICAMLNVTFEDHVEDVGERLGKDAAYTLDSANARQQLDWSDTVSLENGLAATISWVKDNLDILSGMPRHYIHKR